MKKDNAKSIIVLSVICLVVAVALAAINFVTSPIIEKAAQEKVQASLKEALPDADNFGEPIKLSEDAPKTVVAVYESDNDAGYAVTVSTKSQYSNSNMTYTVGINSDGKIVNVVLTNYAETKDFGKDYPQKYVGADADGVEDVATFSGVTYSSTAFKDALKEAMSVVNNLQEVKN